MKKAVTLFAEKEQWILDGGLATELEQEGIDLNHPLWSAKALKENPEAIFETHLSYLEAGADILLTASYQASIEGFMKYEMYNREARETIFSSVMLACYAKEKYLETHTQRPILIGGSCGPYGAIKADRSEYTGEYENEPGIESKWASYYFDKIEVLLSPRKHFQIDFLIFETLPSLKEAKFILSHMRKYPYAPVVFSFSREEEAIKAAKEFAQDTQVAAVGLNCMSTEKLTHALPAIAHATTKPVIAYPSGLQANWKSFANLASELKVKIIGGCCYATPHDIKDLSNYRKSQL